jgi:hypothetical protein
MVMNFYEKAGDVLPLMVAWNGEISRFLAREPKHNVLAVTY